LNGLSQKPLNIVLLGAGLALLLAGKRLYTVAFFVAGLLAGGFLAFTVWTTAAASITTISASVKMYIAAALALVPLVSATVGFCNDKDISCGSWSRDGLCDSDAVVKDLCPHSCGVCSLMCSDREENCKSWALEGECTKSPDYMLKECATSCGLCAPKCADVHVDCNHWGKEGQCEGNPGFMHLNCPVTCGVCRGTCKDVHDDCPGWAKDGECVNNPGHTLKACPVSCGVSACKTETGCTDKNSTACAIWALDEECTKNPAMMLVECAATCGTCNVVCEDKSKDCANWASEGQCTSNAEGMLTTCPQSCGLCHDLELFYRGAIGGDKDEL